MTNSNTFNNSKDNDNLITTTTTNTTNPINSSTKLLSNVSEVLRTINESELIIVYFYTQWCGTCKNANPLYDNAAQIWKSSNAIFTRFDCELEEKLCEDTFDLFYVPSWKIWKNGELIANIEGDWTDLEPSLNSLIGPPTDRVVLDEATERMMEVNRAKFIELSNSIKERRRLESEQDSSRGTSHSRSSGDSEVSELEIGV